jgi:hypothetical protein
MLFKEKTTSTRPTATSTPSRPPPTKPNTRVIAGGAVGGLVALFILAAVLWRFVFRRTETTLDDRPEIDGSSRLELPIGYDGPMPIYVNMEQANVPANPCPVY